MLNIDVKFSGDTKERIEALINGFDKKRGDTLYLTVEEFQ